MLSLALLRDDAEVCKPDHCFLQAQCCVFTFSQHGRLEAAWHVG